MRTMAGRTDGSCGTAAGQEKAANPRSSEYRIQESESRGAGVTSPWLAGAVADQPRVEKMLEFRLQAVVSGTIGTARRLKPELQRPGP